MIGYCLSAYVLPLRLLPGLGAVESGAQTIANTIDAFLSTPPDDVMPAFLEALNLVGGTAYMMMENVQTYIGRINGAGGECDPDSIGLPPEACVPPCTWIPTDPTAGVSGYCCCPADDIP